MNIPSYEDVEFLRQRNAGQLSEMYSGQDIVEWWGSIERTLKNKLGDYAQQEGKDKELNELRTFLIVWQANQLTGSINKATVKTLAAAANQAAIHDDLDTAGFFSRLRDSLNRLIASVEELPTVPSSTGRQPPGGRKPPMPTGQFGAQKKPPGPSGVNAPGETEAPTTPAGTVGKT
jgi:hypothetical protein